MSISSSVSDRATVAKAVVATTVMLSFMPFWRAAVAVTVKRISSYGSGGFELDVGQIFSNKIAELFNKAVTIAEMAGKHVKLLVVPGRDYNRAVVEASQRLQSNLVVMGLSAKMTPSEPDYSYSYRDICHSRKIGDSSGASPRRSTPGPRNL